MTNSELNRLKEIVSVAEASDDLESVKFSDLWYPDVAEDKIPQIKEMVLRATNQTVILPVNLISKIIIYCNT